MADANVIERELRIEAEPGTVFDFFVDPEKMCRWMGTRAELDPRPGGGFRVDIDGSHVAVGEYLEVSRPDRVVYTWGWEGGEPIAPGGSTVEVDLTPDGDGTLVRFVHRGLDEQTGPMHAEGWDHYLPRLEAVAAGGDPGPDEWASAESGTRS